MFQDALYFVHLLSFDQVRRGWKGGKGPEQVAGSRDHGRIVLRYSLHGYGIYLKGHVT